MQFASPSVIYLDVSCVILINVMVVLYHEKANLQTGRRHLCVSVSSRFRHDDDKSSRYCVACRLKTLCMVRLLH